MHSFTQRRGRRETVRRDRLLLRQVVFGPPSQLHRLPFQPHDGRLPCRLCVLCSSLSCSSADIELLISVERVLPFLDFGQLDHESHLRSGNRRTLVVSSYHGDSNPVYLRRRSHSHGQGFWRRQAGPDWWTRTSSRCRIGAVGLDLGNHRTPPLSPFREILMLNKLTSCEPIYSLRSPSNASLTFLVPKKETANPCLSSTM